MCFLIIVICLCFVQTSHKYRIHFFNLFVTFESMRIFGVFVGIHFILLVIQKLKTAKRMGYYQTKWEFILRVSGNDKYDMVCDISWKTLIVYGPIHSFFLVANKYRKKRWSLAFHYFRLEKVEHSSQLNPLLLFGFVVVGSTLFRKS